MSRYEREPAFVKGEMDTGKANKEFADSFEGEDTEVTRLPRPKGRMKRLLTVGGILGAVYLSGSLGAGSMLSSGCSSVVRGVKSAAASLVYTTPSELVEEMRETFQDYKAEIEHGSYLQELGELQEALDQFQSPTVRAAELRRMLEQPELESLLSRVYPGNPKELDKYLNSLLKVFDKYQSLEERKRDTLIALDNLKDKYTKEERSALAAKVMELYKPEEQYKMAVATVTSQNRSYAVMQELARYLTPQQKSSLAAMLNFKPATPATATPAAPAAKVPPAARTSPAAKAPSTKTIIVPGAKAAVPGKAPNPQATSSYNLELAQQKARGMAREIAVKEGGVR